MEEGDIKFHPKHARTGRVYGHNVIKQRGPVNKATKLRDSKKKGPSLTSARSTFYVVRPTSAK
jgi:hypothetical protein